MLSVTQAQQRFADSVDSITGVEQVSLEKTLNRVCAVDVVSNIDVPFEDNSAMDGYAVRAADVVAGEWLPVANRVAAGDVISIHKSLTASRIFTGGVIPQGADAVVIQENCRPGDCGNAVQINCAVEAGANIRRCGQDIACGDTVVIKGKRLSPIDIGLLASIGVGSLQVFKPLKIGIMSTGDELLEPGQPMSSGKVYNSNRYLLAAICQRLGFLSVDLGIVADDLQSTINALQQASDHCDVILSSGGVSVGEEDYIKPAVEQLGELNYWKVQMKPGKPVAFGRIGQTPFIGLPGNPVSSFVVFQLLGIPVLRKRQGEVDGAPICYQVVADFDKKAVSREEYLRVSLTATNRAQLFDNQSSGVLRSLAVADGLLRQQINQAISKDDLVDFLPLVDGLL